VSQVAGATIDLGKTIWPTDLWSSWLQMRHYFNIWAAILYVRIIRPWIRLYKHIIGLIPSSADWTSSFTNSLTEMNLPAAAFSFDKGWNWDYQMEMDSGQLFKPTFCPPQYSPVFQSRTKSLTSGLQASKISVPWPGRSVHTPWRDGANSTSKKFETVGITCIHCPEKSNQIMHLTTNMSSSPDTFQISPYS